MRREKAEERDNRQSKKLLQRVDDGTDLMPQGISNFEHLTDQPTPRKRKHSHLLRNPRYGTSLKTLPRIPLHPKRDLHSPLKLRFARVREWQVLHEILFRFLVFLLGDDDVRFPRVLAL